MTLLGTLFQAVVSVMLTCLPAAFLNQERMRISIGLSFLAIFAAFVAGGLIAAFPCAIFLFLFSPWIIYVGQGTTGAKQTLFIITLVLSALFFVVHAVHLPIRLAFNQSPFKIAINVFALFLSSAMLGAGIELLILRRKAK